MPVTLNFSNQDLEKIKPIFKKFDTLPTKSQYELARWRVLDSKVTLYASGKLLIQGIDAEKVKDFIMQELPEDDEFVLGIDEVGRGESFGPLVVVGILGKTKEFLELRDSKKIKDIVAKKELLDKIRIKGFFIESFSAKEIDEARTNGRTMNDLQVQAYDDIIEQAEKSKLDFQIKIDGSPMPLKTKKKVAFIVKGDDKEPVISAASVLAKFTRSVSKDKGKRKTWKNTT